MPLPCTHRHTKTSKHFVASLDSFYRYCRGATFTVAVAVAPILLAESSGVMVAPPLFSCFLALLATATFNKREINFSAAHLSESEFLANPVIFHVVDMLCVTYVPSPSNLHSRL